ncbi:MAG: hypothetical protein AAGG68_28625 [Bacteroidota bacterium]
MKTVFTTIFIAFTSLLFAQNTTETAINQVVLEAYKAIGFEKGTSPDYVAIKAIFTPKAMLYNYRSGKLEITNIDEFLAGYKGMVESDDFTAFREIELGGKTEYFGKIGHRISAYASYINGMEEVGERGVNSFQLVQVKGKWLISSIIWDIESKNLPIPEQYLSKQ